MLPDLSPHLHTSECNLLIQLLKNCWNENKIKKYIGECNYWDEAVWQCTKQERIYRRDTNPKYGKRLVENKRLPESYYTPALKKLKEQGVLLLDTESTGCKI
ncbi:unnamed protein product [Bursaphelenchus okinawaensis]|uniref:COX assembly mitochondrial protein n=1 Tax=Bursaphelenchus okinawaensis TaxID=465554 RepID=A0A811KFM4_9BILA|nr:unnamed protein product [Bursaphelenchus okinawaensis]CAG9103602.1 unnamed protein product [Bursaphelenchus okinawaensis]